MHPIPPVSGRGPRVIIFGCGSSGRRAFETLRARHCVVGFADNNTALHGTRLFDLPVYAPAELGTLDCDRVYIASMFHPEIQRQLIEELGLSARRVRLAPEFAPPTGLGLLPGLLRECGVPAGRDDWRLWRMRNRHRGRRAFIIGNGPSLRLADLERLGARGEITLASNRIFRAFAQTSWRPTYYGFQDPDIARRDRAEIDRWMTGETLVADCVRHFIPPAPNRTFFHLIPAVAPPARPPFATELLRGVQCGTTITYVLLQFAAWMGFAEVYLLGVDFSYQIRATVAHEEYKKERAYVTDPGAPQNYFVADYHRPGEVLVQPRLEEQRLAYLSARDAMQRPGGMRILNATRGGQLEVFERVSFDTLCRPV